MNVGETMTLYCTANAPAGGWITHAFFSLANQEDAKYLGISYNSTDQKATLYGLSPKASIKVEVTYAYSYRGSYDNNIHVGSGTYYEYVTVKGGGVATDIRFDPQQATIKVGQTISVKVITTPQNTSTPYTYGTITSLGKPFNFDVQDAGDCLIITAKGKGTLYLAAQTENNKVGTCTINAVEDDDDLVSPESIELSQSSVELSIGGKKQINYTLSPNNSATSLVWTSSDEKVATVSGSGLITAVGAGSCNIMVVTENGLKATVKVSVLPSPTSISLPSSIDVTIGFSYSLEPVFAPKNAVDELRWRSSDTDVASVSATGVVTGFRDGSAKITVKGNSGVESECNVNIVRPKSGMDSKTVSVRVASVKALVSRSLSNR
ncbi:MAG: Ig-like domain-containing protein [Muribaculum sp.]|nr:Ig-like domain-containing protein [Muribaculum sp.]